MRAWLVVAPVWVRVVVLAAVMVPLVAAIGTLSFRYGSTANVRPWSVSLFVGLAMAVLVGGSIAVGAAMAGRSQGTHPELRAFSPEQRGAALRALRRGPAPTDPAARAVALNLAWRSLHQGRDRRRTSVYLMSTAAVLITAPSLFTHSVVGLLGGAAAVFAVVMTLREPRRLRRRLAVLEGRQAAPVVRLR